MMHRVWVGIRVNFRRYRRNMVFILFTAHCCPQSGGQTGGLEPAPDALLAFAFGGTGPLLAPRFPGP